MRIKLQKTYERNCPTYVFACFDIFIMPFNHTRFSLTHTHSCSGQYLCPTFVVMNLVVSYRLRLYICPQQLAYCPFHKCYYLTYEYYSVLLHAKFFISDNSLSPEGSLRIYFYGVQFL